jgi:hypothetical protein
MIRQALCRFAIASALLTCFGCSSRNSEFAAALAPVGPDELPQFNKRETDMPLGVGIVDAPQQSYYDVDIPLEFPSTDPTPEEQAELDRREREQFTYDYLDLADLTPRSPLIIDSRGGIQTGINPPATGSGISPATSIVGTSREPRYQPSYSPSSSITGRSAGRGGAEVGIAGNSRQSMHVSPATKIVTVRD